MIKRFRERYSHLKLWQKLLMLYLFMSIIPVLALSIFTCVISTMLMQQQVSTRLDEMTGNIGTRINENLSLIDKSSEKFLYNDSFLQFLFSDNRSTGYLQQLKEPLNEIKDELDPIFNDSVRVELILPDDSTVTTADSSPLISYQNTLGHFSDNTNRTVICSQNEAAVFYRIINPYKGTETVAIAKVSLAPPLLMGNFSLQISDEYIFAIQDKNDNTVYIEMHTRKNYGQIVLNLLNRSDNNTMHIRDDAYLYQPYYLKETEWTLCTLVPKSVLYQGFPTILGYCIGMGLLCLLLISICSVLSSLNLSKRINNISSEMELIGEGQLDLQMDVDTSGDEIGQLSTLFNRMIERINSLVIEQYKNEIKSKEEQLHILQNQINPHFLYNCMDTINWRSIMNNDTKTSAFANNLADFYRTCLNNGNTKISLSDEFRNIRAYVYLQLDMHDNSFDYNEDVDEEIYNYQGINLMLQPIIENAIEHGLELNSGLRGQIKISAGFAEENSQKLIKINIFNNGKPIAQDVAEAVMKGEKGYGLSNVTNRIKLFFGSEYGVIIRPDKGGTVCEITIPARRWDE